MKTREERINHEKALWKKWKAIDPNIKIPHSSYEELLNIIDEQEAEISYNKERVLIQIRENRKLIKENQKLKAKMRSAKNQIKLEKNRAQRNDGVPSINCLGRIEAVLHFNN